MPIHKITYTFEAWKDLWPEMEPLMNIEHAPEVSFLQEHMKVNIDTKHHQAMDDLGYLDNLAVRDNGTLIGYCIVGRYPNPHFMGVKTAFQLHYFLRKQYRGQGIGKHMFQTSEAKLREQGIEVVTTGAKTSLPYAAVFRSLGWHEVETLFAKWIGD